MRVEIDFEGGKNAAGIYVHKKLPEAMGNSVAAFAHAVLSGHTAPGVWYPEEREALAVREWERWGWRGRVRAAHLPLLAASARAARKGQVALLAHPCSCVSPAH